MADGSGSKQLHSGLTIQLYGCNKNIAGRFLVGCDREY
jgi:hypothetical protein